MNAKLLGCAAGLAVGVLAPVASANCAMPVEYGVTVKDNTVTVCPANFAQRGCPDADGMLRQDANGNTVKLGDYCDSDSGTGCYVDECVPKGEYKYGFAKPYDCCSSCCGTDYYGTASVTTDLPSSCTASAGNPGTTPFTGTVPWTDSQTICVYGGLGGSSGTAGTSSGGASGSGGPTSSGSSGCSVRGPRTAERTVLAFNLLVAALGLGLIARRRK